MAESDKRLRRRGVTDFARAQQLAGKVREPVTSALPTAVRHDAREHPDMAVPVVDTISSTEPGTDSGRPAWAGGGQALSNPIPPPQPSSQKTNEDAPPGAADHAVPSRGVPAGIAALGKGVRVTIYPTPAAVDYIDDCLYLARKAKRTGMRDRTVLFRAFGEAVRISGFDPGAARDEAELIHLLVERLSRCGAGAAIPGPASLEV